MSGGMVFVSATTVEFICNNLYFIHVIVIIVTCCNQFPANI